MKQLIMLGFLSVVLSFSYANDDDTQIMGCAEKSTKIKSMRDFDKYLLGRAISKGDVYCITKDLDFENKKFPKGYVINNVSGELYGAIKDDGEPVKLENIKLTNESMHDSLSFIKTIREEGVVSNIHLENLTIVSAIGMTDIAGMAYEMKENAEIRDSSVTGVLQGSDRIAGFVFDMTGGIIENSETFGELTGDSASGFVYKLNNGKLTSNQFYMNITAVREAAGLVHHQSAGVIEYGESHGFVKANKAAGLVFSQGGGEIKLSSSSAMVTTPHDFDQDLKAAGLVFYQTGGKIYDSYVTADAEITGFQASGLVFSQFNDASIRNSSSSAKIKGVAVAGLLFHQENGEIHHSYVSSDAKLEGDAYAAGLVIKQVNGKIYNSYSLADIEDVSYAAGLVIEQVNGEIHNSFSSSMITADNVAAGLVLNKMGGKIHNSYSDSEINSKDYAAGLIYEQKGGEVENSYSSATINAERFKGLIYDKLGGTCKASYWDNENADTTRDDCEDGHGKSTEEMQGVRTYVGWKMIKNCRESDVNKLTTVESAPANWQEIWCINDRDYPDLVSNRRIS